MWIDKYTDKYKGPYEERLKKAAKDITRDFRARFGSETEKYDYTPFREKRRREVAEKGLNSIKQHLRGVCDEQFLVDSFVFTNCLIMRGGYNYAVDEGNIATLSAAIWILDQLSLQGKLAEAYPHLPLVPNDKLPEDLLMPFVIHPMYDQQLIISMMQLIRHRNTSRPIAKAEKGVIQWDANVQEKDAEAQKNRAAYDSIISLIDPKAIEQAVKKYEQAVWDFYRISFSAMSCVCKRISEIEEQLDEIERESAPAIIDFKQANALLTKKNTASFGAPNVLPRSGGNTDFRAVMLHKELEKLAGITFTCISLANDRERTLGELKGVVPKDLANEIIHFHVDDPFETAFALLYLLDTGSDIPWYYYGSISVAYTMCDQLPLDAKSIEPQNPKLLSEWNNALYEHRYSGYRWPDVTDVSGEPVKRTFAKNLSQLIYSNTDSLFPRVIPGLQTLDSFLEELGDLSQQEREAYSMLLYSLHAQILRAQSLGGYRLETEADSVETEQEESVVTAENDPQEMLELLRSDNTRLREKNSALLQALKENRLIKQQQTTRADRLAETLELQRKELADLREKVFLLENQDLKEEPEDQTIKYPYHTTGRILSFGGHPSWIKEMKKKLPDVMFIAPDTLPNVDLIRGADTVWIQTNCISHSDYFKIMDTVKDSGIQIRYFVWAGANKCAEQLVNAQER